MAADDGDAACAFVLGMQYFWGIARRRSEEEAVEWFNRAATAGLSDAQNALGLCYAEGTGIHEDKKAAAKWYTKAAEQGDLYAMLNLSFCYMLGMGVKTNAVQAEAPAYSLPPIPTQDGALLPIPQQSSMFPPCHRRRPMHIPAMIMPSSKTKRN